MANIAIVSEKTSPACLQTLRARGYTPILCPQGKRTAPPLAYHPDMHLASLGGRIFCGEDFFLENRDFFRSLHSFGKAPEIIPLPDRSGECYPADCAYNLLTVGDAVFYNPKSIAPSLLSAAEALGYRLFPTRQGYAACTVLPLGAHYAITADAGMEKALPRAGIEVLKISEGSIALPPYAHGFIGGCGGTHGNAAYFYGDIRRHPDFEAMQSFATKAGFSLIPLSEEPLCDLGGILFIE